MAIQQIAEGIFISVVLAGTADEPHQALKTTRATLIPVIKFSHDYKSSLSLIALTLKFQACCHAVIICP